MVEYCNFCEVKHDDYQWRFRIENGEPIHLCRKAFDSIPDIPTGVPVDLSKKGKRLAHWKEITTRITTHEGELLSGSRGREYTQKFGQKYLGINPRPVNFDSPSFQKELAKTK